MSPFKDFNLKHLPLPPPHPDDQYRPFRFNRGGDSDGGPKYPPRPDVRLHGNSIRGQIERVKKNFEDETPTLEEWKERLAAFGIILEISGKAGFDLATGSLETPRDGVRLLRREIKDVGEDSETVVAIVFIEYAKIAKFLKKIEDYASGKTVSEDSEKIKNASLVSGIETIRSATLRALWSDGDELFPAGGQVSWWEFWIRRSGVDTTPEDDPVFRQFGDAASEAGMERSREILTFPEQFVVLVKARPEEIARSLPILSTLQELRRPKDHAGFFMRESPAEQKSWADTLISRLEISPSSAPAVCLLDTGVNRGHPLLRDSITEDDCDAYERFRMGVDDRDGHGTQMAGLALYGDLTPILPSAFSITLGHRLESVKVIPSSGTAYGKIHYAYITKECIARPETWEHSERNRVYCLTITSTEDLDKGRPSAWSAAFDAAIFNEAHDRGDDPRLVCVSAGNLPRAEIPGYPKVNETASCHDPAQAWNAITVGAYTEKDIPDPEDFPGWSRLAEPGSLCPASTTGCAWNQNWPNKPDIVMEGGNYATHPEHPGQADTPDCLQLLTTHHRPTERMFACTGDTSAAAALAARYCAIIKAQNPRRWSETIRALIVHSAEWGPLMSGWDQPDFKPKKYPKKQALGLLQRFGYGVPNLNRALKSARSAVTLIAEEVYQPYKKPSGKSPKVRGYHRYRLPIPTAELRKYGEKNARMRVTLSYFVDPNPTNPHVTSKFRYQGAGLRFDVKGSKETDEMFFSRINRDEKLAKDAYKAKNDSDNWVIGFDNRSRGSLHSDTWYGSAAELAAKDCIAVFPVGGWWKLRPFLGKADHTMRFSLIVSIELDAESANIYTPIETAVAVTT